ncbi:MAG: YesL family protein [Erysipelotrichaceae bacterium]|nr:YesL family protein [Erysipelotrichaceae bacterium]
MSGKRDYYDSNPLLEFGELVFNLMVLNVLWVLCSFLVVTIGASCTALNYTCIKMRRDEGDSVIKMFFRSFTMNLRQALILGTGMLIIFILLLAGFIQFLGMAYAGSLIGKLLTVVVVLVFCIWLIAYTYMFMLLARFDNSLKETLRNTLYFSLVEYKTTFKLLVREITFMIVIPVICFYFLPYLFPMFIFFGMPVITYINAKDFNEMFEDFLANQKS